MPSPVIFGGPSRVLEARRYTSSSEAASLYGKPALTPIIAGSICGGLLFISWTIGFIVYFRKRTNRKKRKRLIAEGKAQPRQKDLKILEEKIVIPPDPAVLLGHRKAGEMVFPERESSSPGRLPWSRLNSRALPASGSKATSTSETSGKSTGTPLTNDTVDAKPHISDGPAHPVTDALNRPKFDAAVASKKASTTDHSSETDEVEDVMTVPAKI